VGVKAAAEAEAKAYAAAQAVAQAFAEVQASASAIAEAEARAAAAASAAAEAYAQAQVAVQAAAYAAASADTSVSVMSDIHSSTRTLIDKDCLADMCREYTPPTTPTTPTTPTQPTGCPEPQSMTWKFGEFQGGMFLTSTKSLPYEISSTLDELNIVGAFQESSELPDGVSFSLNLDNRSGTLRGSFPGNPATYRIFYRMIDANKCAAATLIVVISVGGGGQTTTPTTPTTPELSVVVTNVAVEQLCGDNYSHAVTVYYETHGGTPPVSIQGIQWTLPDGSSRVTTGISMTSGWVRMPVEYPSGGQVSVKVIARDGAGHTASDTGGAYLQPCEAIGTPPVEQPCVHVSAVLSGGIPTTTAYMRPQVTEIPVEMVVNGKLKYITPYDLCGEPGTRFFIQAPRDFWTQQEAHLYFVGWERYDQEQQKWVPLSDNPKITQNPNIAVNLKNGGSLRAVYQQRGQG